MPDTPVEQSRSASKSPVQHEAEGDATVDVKYRGKTYTLPADAQDWPVKVARALKDAGENPIAAIDGIATLFEWSGIAIDDWSTRHTTELFGAYTEMIGITVGEA